jgi:hypothetical protein
MCFFGDGKDELGSSFLFWRRVRSVLQNLSGFDSAGGELRDKLGVGGEEVVIS